MGWSEVGTPQGIVGHRPRPRPSLTLRATPTRGRARDPQVYGVRVGAGGAGVHPSPCRGVGDILSAPGQGMVSADAPPQHLATAVQSLMPRCTATETDQRRSASRPARTMWADGNPLSAACLALHSQRYHATEDGPMPGQRRGRWMPPRQRGHQVHEEPRRERCMPTSTTRERFCWIGGDEMASVWTIPKGAQGDHQQRIDPDGTAGNR